MAALEPAAAEPLAETTCSQLLSVLTAANSEGLAAQDAAACNSINADCLVAAARGVPGLAQYVPRITPFTRHGLLLACALPPSCV